MSDTIDLSVIIVTWNSQEWILRCLRSVYAQTSDLRMEVIVVDNASTDKTIQSIMNTFQQVAMITNTQNLGFAAAVNQGLRASSGRTVCWLNPDTEIRDRALEQLVAYLDSHEDVGIVAPQLHNVDGSTQASVRRFPQAKDQALIVSKLHALWPDAKSVACYLARDFDYTREQEVDQVMGACMVVRRSLIEAIGPLDAKFFIWFEEVDFCYRTKTQSTYRIVYAPHAHVLHFGGDSFDKVRLTTKQRWYRKSVRYYMRKHGFWGAYILLLTLTPLSLMLGVFMQLFLRTKKGKQMAKDRKNNYKQT